MTTASRPPTARLRTPGDIAAVLPGLCGFHPRDSVVVLSLRGRRRRLGLTMRLDLPPPEQTTDVAAALLARVRHDGGSAAVVAVFSEAARRPDLVDALVDAGELAGAPVVEALHVADGRWTSYLCTGLCGPQAGTRVGAAPPLVRAQQTLDGRAVLGSRDELVASLAPPHPAAGRAPVDAARRARQAQVQRLGPDATRAAGLDQVARALDLVDGGGAVDADAAAALALLLHDVRARDEVASWALERGDAVLALAEQVARLVGPPDDAPVCTLLAWVAYSRGDGARASIALDRALRADPGYSLALLLQAALEGALPPEEIRRAMRGGGRISSPGSPSSC